MSECATTAFPHRTVARVERSTVRAARRRTAGHIRKTPVFHTSVSSPSGPVPVTIKLEHLQHGGTYEVRGSANALLESGQDADEVVIASGGNAGIAAALAAARLGKTCTVVAPETAPHTKVAAMWSYGAEVLWYGATYSAALLHANDLAADRGAVLLHAYDLPASIAGAGVVGLELEEQVRGRPPVLAPVSGGNLVAGIAAAIGRRQQVIGVEPEQVAILRAALTADGPVNVARCESIVDSLGPCRVGDIAFDIARRHGVRSLPIDEDAIGAAREYLWREFHLLVELSSAASLAAIHSGAYVPATNERPIVVLSGANTDISVF
ncbi:serine/threonine dehydratase [Nocardia sp. CNY236]|uniref:serine/threonine dehydratase n=1 Tax=Nocardia sp. CNY236 TaxID=1169152 RepID=UPI000414B820|nr:serine/threonine dehydratase [Nocardia sp. CNY236]